MSIFVKTIFKTAKNTGFLPVLRRFFSKGLLQLLFPLRCPVCDSIVTPFGEKICTECIPKLPPLSPPWCMKCGKKLLEEEEICKDCKKTEHLFVRGRSVYEYGGIRLPLYRFKYGKRREYADFFGEETAMYLKDFIDRIRPDALVPVPLHGKRLAERGYNQAQLFARGVSDYTGIPVYERAVLRVKNTRPMKFFGPSERQNNLKNAFILGQNDVKLKTIIIIDDIYTTGATIDAVAGCLKSGGAGDIYFITLASGTGV